MYYLNLNFSHPVRRIISLYILCPIYSFAVCCKTLQLTAAAARISVLVSQSHMTLYVYCLCSVR